jgi:hypothetical protein
VSEIAAILAVGTLCGAWVALQRWVARLDPAQPGVEGARCGACRGGCERRCDDDG